MTGLRIRYRFARSGWTFCATADERDRLCRTYGVHCRPVGLVVLQ